MVVILTLSDLITLNKQEPLNHDIIAHVTKHFDDLFESLAEEGETLDTFTLGEHGPIVVLTSQDQSEDLTAVGLCEGLIGSLAEFVEQIHLGDTIVWFGGVLVNNERMISLFAVSGQIAPEIEAWFRAGGN